MDIYNLLAGVQIVFHTDEAQTEMLSADFDEIDNELMLENKIGRKI
jgi:hypothetical protein